MSAQRPATGASERELTVDEYAVIGAHVAVKKDRPRAEVLAPFGLTEARWAQICDAFTQRMVAEVKERAGTGGPIEERYPLSAGYAKAYATAVKEAKKELLQGGDESTVRLPPGTPTDEPLSLLGASNRAARS